LNRSRAPVSTFTLSVGMGYHVADDAEAHLSHTNFGATLFIVE